MIPATQPVTGKVFMTGRSQAVRIPKAFRFDATELEFLRTPYGVTLRPVRAKGPRITPAEAVARMQALRQSEGPFDMPPRDQPMVDFRDPFEHLDAT